MRRRPLLLGLRLGLVLVTAASATALAPGGTVAPSASPDDRPSIVLILTDDQRWDTMWAMPTVQHELVAHGVTFSNAYVVDPLCCPSRTSILTGDYSHTTGVYRNHPPFGGFPSFDDRSTIATWLQATGYRTALIGKYLNEYRDASGGTYVPPGWSRWAALATDGGGAYYGYDLNIGGRLVHFRHRPQDYSTDVLAHLAARFIRRTDGPLFLEFTPSAPHGPAVPPARYADAFSTLSSWRPPSYNEADVSDKPRYIRSRPLSLVRPHHTDRFRINQYRTLLAVDDAVSRILEALRSTGRLGNTLIVLASDNGFAWGEHRWVGKAVPYEESIRIPMVVRYDPLAVVPRTDPHLVLNIDLAPTFASVAGLVPGAAEGQDLLPLLSSPDAPWRTDFLVEWLAAPFIDEGPDAYCAVHDERYVYIAYDTGEEELYDLDTDPYELENQADAPQLAGVQARLMARVAELCHPAPPVTGSSDWLTAVISG